MSPKKTVKNPSSKRKIIEKMPKRTVKKEKSKLNMPVNLKVSIPFTINSSEEGIHMPIIRGRGAPRFKKHLDLETKVELANSVARLQLLKQETPQIEIVNNIENNAKTEDNAPRRRRQSKAKVVSKFFQDRVVIDNTSTDGVVNSTVTKEPAKKANEKRPAPTRRIVTRKRLANSIAEKAAKLQKVESNAETEKVLANIKLEDDSHDVNWVVPDSNPAGQPQSVVETPKPVVEQPKPIVEQTKPKVNKNPIIDQPQPVVVEQQPTDVKIKPKAKKPKSIKPPPSTARKEQPLKRSQPLMKPPVPRKKRATKGKQDVIPDKSPALLDWLTKLPKQTENEVRPQPNVPKLVSRNASVSSNSNLSWTKEISSSSTTTCVTVSSNDFVCINNKLPVLKLTNIDSELKKRNIDVKETVDVGDGSSDSSDSDTSCTISEKKQSERLQDPIDVNSLHLSASSRPSSHFSPTRNNENTVDYVKAAEKLSLTLKKIDMEIINWISSENEDINPNLAKFKDKMFDILDTEFGVITHCRRLKEILDPPKMYNVTDETCLSKPVEEITVCKDVEKASVAEISNEIEFVKPRPCRKLSTFSERNVSSAGNSASKDECLEDDILTSNNKNYPNYDLHDDDDTLSLFAESITGFESSRINTSIASATDTNAHPVEEYIPQPLTENYVANTEKHTYYPTKINEEAENIASKISENQNGDTTSIFKQSNSTTDTESYKDFNENTELDIRIGPPEIKRPRLMENFFEIVPKTRSVVFGNLCFYNLLNCCRKVMFGQCRYVHVIPSSAQIKAKLNLLDERMLIQEYLLLRNWIDLRRRYGMCYVEECAKRGLTRILVEMAYDFIVKARSDSEEDTRLRVNTIEATLLHLNSVDLSVCEDLLKLPIPSDKVNRTLLCDVFMATMSITQNFSRFKAVFLNLTYFMVNNDRKFNKVVVGHFLERACILPFEESVARALIQMMRSTKSEIFKNSMIALFEKQISVNKDVFEEYTLLKNQCAFTSMLASAVVSSPPLNTSTIQSNGDDQPPVPSPDTAKLDSMNKTEKPSQPQITRTIGMNQSIIYNRAQASPGANRVQDNPNTVNENHGSSRPHDNPVSTRFHDNHGSSKAHTSSGSSNSEEIVNIRKWRNRSIFPHLRPLMAERAPMRGPMRTPLRPPMKNHMRPPLRMPFNQRLVTFRSPNYVNRQPGPKY